MSEYASGFNPWTWLRATALAVLIGGCGGGTDDGILGGPGTPGGGPGPAGAGPALDAASSFGIASTAGITNTGATTINGDVVLANPTVTCNAVAVPGGAGTAGFGLCAGAPPTLIGTVVTPSSPDVTTANNVKAAMNSGFLGITPLPDLPRPAHEGAPPTYRLARLLEHRPVAPPWWATTCSSPASINRSPRSS